MMNEAWLQRLRDDGATADTVYDDGRYEDLKTRLLNEGGVAVIFINLDRDKRLERLMSDGTWFSFIEDKLIGGVTDLDATVCSYCDLHNFKHYSGFALNGNGLWQYHSWAVDGKRAIELVDTSFSLRFGIPDFWGKNYLEYLDHSYREHFFKENNIL